ncbi:MAG: UvrD-helicase domain-containing protein [Actinomycetales bacterium]
MTADARWHAAAGGSNGGSGGSSGGGRDGTDGTLWSAEAVAAALGLPAPTDEQVAVIELGLGPALVVAGAGSGKTETMAGRVVWLVANGLVEPDAVLGLTFTRKAATELSARIRRRLRGLGRLGLAAADGLAAGAEVSTYHGFAGALVKEHGLRLSVEPDARLLTEAASWQLAAGVVEHWTDDLPSVTAAVSTVIDAVLALAAECAEHLVALEDVEGWLEQLLREVEVLPRKVGQAAPGAPFADVAKALSVLRGRRELIPLVRRYAEVKRHRGLLDFGDQMALAAQLASRFPEVVAAARARHRVVLLDEFQDTSHAQLLLLSSLFGQGHPVTAVGDPSQSIYGWRGASAGALLRFPQVFRTAPEEGGEPAPVVTLSTSWRNDAAILDIANVVSAELRAEAALPELQPRPGAGAGLVRLARALTDLDEAAWVAVQIEQLRALPDGGHRSCAVLCRARSQFPAVVDALEARGLPVQVVGLGGLLSVPEVDELVALLQVVADPTRGDALIRLVSGPRVRMAPRDLDVLGRLARQLTTAVTHGAARQVGAAQGDSPGIDGEPPLAASEPAEPLSIVDALEALRVSTLPGASALSEEARGRLSDVARTVAALRSRLSTTLLLPELVLECERALDLDIEVAARPGVPPDDARVHLDAFLQTAADFDAAASSGGGTTGGTGGAAHELTAFLAWLDVAVEQERGLQPGEVTVDPEAVQVLTVHAAKGLEWDVVAVPGMVEGQFPAAKDTDGGWLVGLGPLPYPLRGDAGELPEWRWREAESQEELRDALATFRSDSGAHQVRDERRLAYVAVTRAREVLLASAHLWSEAKRPRTVSRFLEEMASVAARPTEDATAQATSIAVPGVEVAVWVDDESPRPEELGQRRVSWPLDPLGPRRAGLQAAAQRVLAAREALAGDTDAPPQRPETRWTADLDALLRERAERGEGSAGADRRLPPSLSVSAVVDYRDDPQSFLLELRRPVPRPPARGARRGTSFHAWVEQHFADAALLDLDELDELVPEPELEQLKSTFLASEWATRLPLGVEVPFETPMGDVVVRGRIDAVFAVPGRAGEVEIVDWKTGSRHRDEKSHVAQLALYRLAWSRLHGVPMETVRVALYYAATGETWRPTELPDVSELEALFSGAART